MDARRDATERAGWTRFARSPASESTRRQFALFSMIGFVALFVDMGALWTALNLIGLDLYVGRVFSYLVAATFTWICNRTLTFVHAGPEGLLRQWSRFIFFNAIGGTVNLAVFVLVAVKLGSAATWPSEIAAILPYFAVACGSASGLAFNFLASKFLVFR